LHLSASRLLTAQNNFSTVNRHYDAANRMDYDEQVLVGGLTKRVQYAYDNANENTQLFVNDGNGYDRTFKFDGMGRFSKVTNTGDSAVWFTYTYDRSSNRIDRLNNLTGIHQDYGTPDQVNRMQKRELKIGATRISAPGALESYSYSSMNRLTKGERFGVRSYY
jgi:hypothetical protein